MKSIAASLRPISGIIVAMVTRRQFFRRSLAVLAAAAAGATRAQNEGSYRIWLPRVQTAPPLDAPILGPASGTTDQAIAWFAARTNGYTVEDVTTIVYAYQNVGTSAGMDWFLTLAQLAHETGSLTSWWSYRPRRNPAGIGVTGRMQAGSVEWPPGPGWAWDGMQWREGWSFPTWEEHAVPAHMGRLLAYALRDEDANDTQLALIKFALSYRPLPASYRGVAPTMAGLNGRWAVPGEGYGERIVDLARRMRGG